MYPAKKAGLGNCICLESSVSMRRHQQLLGTFSLVHAMEISIFVLHANMAQVLVHKLLHILHMSYWNMSDICILTLHLT